MGLITRLRRAGGRPEYGRDVGAGAAGGGAAARGVAMGIQATTCVAESDAEARANLKYARWQNRANRSLRRGAVINGAVEGGPYEGEPSEDDFFNSLYYEQPETVIGKFRRWRR